MITVQVKKNQISATKAKLEPMTSGSQNVYPVQFLFSAEWKYLEKVAVFATEMSKDGPGTSVYNVLIDDDDRCFIPWEVNLAHSNHVYVGVYGTMNGNVILPTVWADLGNVLLGVTTGLDSEPPTPDIHDQILGKLAEIKTSVANYKTSTDNTISRHQTDVTNQITKYQNETTSAINKHQTDVTNQINKHLSDTTKLVNDSDAAMTKLFNDTVTQIRNDAFGKIAAIRNIVDDFTDSGLQIINGATIVNRNGFPDKMVPVDKDGDGVIDGNMPISKFPRAFILTNTTIASNAEETSLSWSFANEPVYIREEIYVDEHENQIPALYITDMTGTTRAVLMDDTGNFNDMVEIIDPPIHYEDIVGTPDIHDVTRMKTIAITLRADQWIATVNSGAELDLDTSDEEIETDTETLPPIVTQIVRMWGISETQRDQLIIPIPRQDCEGAYYGANIKLAGQDLNTLYFRAWNGIPEEDLVVYIYIANSTTYQWIDPPPPPTPGSSCGSCVDYEFDGGLIAEPNVEGKVFVSVDTVDDFTGDMNRPMSAKGVYEILGNIERLIDKL